MTTITDEQIQIAEDQLSIRFIASANAVPGERSTIINAAALDGFTEALEYLGLSYRINSDGTAKIWNRED